MVKYIYPNGRIAIFAKAPIPGQVKTRMQPALNTNESAELQAKLIKHTINTALSSQVAPVQLWCAPDTSHTAFAPYADRLELLPQQGIDLGQRMAGAFQHNHSQEFTLLIGTDCPSLTPVYLRNAALEAQRGDICIAPAHDGGYVLIAGTGQPKCFQGIEWGSEKVLQQSLSALAQAGQTAHLLEALPDLDHPEDLARLPSELIQAIGIETLAKSC